MKTKILTHGCCQNNVYQLSRTRFEPVKSFDQLFIIGPESVTLKPDNLAKLIRYKGTPEGGTVAEWSKALLLREKINEKPKKIPGLPLAWATF